MIYRLYQQCPRCLTLEIGFKKRAVEKLPGVAPGFNDSRFNCVFHGKPGQLICINGRSKAGQGIANQQWFSLPVFGEELVCVEIQFHRFQHTYQIGEVWARSCIVADPSSGGSDCRAIAS